jgi:hypothetical protein
MIVIIILIFCLSNIVVGQTWQFFEVDEGVKPELDLDSQDNPNISYMLEAHPGYVRHAVFNSSSLMFDNSVSVPGYFYGPLDVAIDQNDMPHINYHNHTYEDQVHLYLTLGGWIEDRIMDKGHDGWDNSITIDENNNPHTSTIDPSGFGSVVGVEYAYFNGSIWQVEAIGSGPIMYANTTSIALDTKGNPHITYYNDSAEDLMYAVRDMGNWIISVVDSAGDVGRFSSLVLDALDVPRISYLQHLNDGIGIVKIAIWNNTEWDITNIDSLDNVFIGFSGARNMTSLNLDSQMNPHLTYSDQKIMKYTKWDGANWQREIIVDASGTSTILGQQTSMQLDNQGYAHIAYYEVTNSVPLRGIVKYVTNRFITNVEQETDNKLNFQLNQNYPNPFNPSTSILYAISSRQFVLLKVYDVLGNEVATLVNEEKPAGTYEVEFSTGLIRQTNRGTLPSGVYFYQLRAGNFIETKKMLLIK